MSASDLRERAKRLREQAETLEKAAQVLEATEPKAEPVFIPTTWTTNSPLSCRHEYPQHYWSINPPVCKKCGQMASSPLSWYGPVVPATGSTGTFLQ